jgi:hypothetical protein
MESAYHKVSTRIGKHNTKYIHAASRIRTRNPFFKLLKALGRAAFLIGINWTSFLNTDMVIKSRKMNLAGRVARIRK